MVKQHYQLNGHELQQTLGDSDGQRRLVCCSPWRECCKESDTTQQLTTTFKKHFAPKSKDSFVSLCSVVSIFWVPQEPTHRRGNIFRLQHISFAVLCWYYIYMPSLFILIWIVIYFQNFSHKRQGQDSHGKFQPLLFQYENLIIGMD